MKPIKTTTLLIAVGGSSQPMTQKRQHAERREHAPVIAMLSSMSLKRPQLESVQRSSFPLVRSNVMPAWAATVFSLSFVSRFIEHAAVALLQALYAHAFRNVSHVS